MLRLYFGISHGSTGIFIYLFIVIFICVAIDSGVIYFKYPCLHLYGIAVSISSLNSYI